MNMENMMCSRCHKRMAVIYMTRMENGKTINEGLCLKCARELGLKPVDDIMSKMGITDDDIDAVSDQLMETMGEAENGDLFQQGGTMPFPFMQNFMGQGGEIAQPREQKAPGKAPERPAEPPSRPVCTRSPLCEGCPYPATGFLCWGRDGKCLRTEMERIQNRPPKAEGGERI